MQDWPDDETGMVELVIEDDRWLDADLESLSTTAVQAVSDWMELPDLKVVVLGCDDARVAALNAEFRGREVPTNVLSWPAHGFAARTPGEVPARPPGPELGDIAISYDTCLRESQEHGKLFGNHVIHLLVHATLHLAGYDHIDDLDADTMEGAEREILNGLDIPDPYLEQER